jgi:hypothetical protein
MQGAKSMMADGSGGTQSGTAAGTGGTSLYHGNVQVDPLCDGNLILFLIFYWHSHLRELKKL